MAVCGQSTCMSELASERDPSQAPSILPKVQNQVGIVKVIEALALREAAQMPSMISTVVDHVQSDLFHRVHVMLARHIDVSHFLIEVGIVEEQPPHLRHPSRNVAQVFVGLVELEANSTSLQPNSLGVQNVLKDRYRP